MKTVTYSQVRANLAQAMDQVCAERTPLCITRENAEPVVLMSLQDYHELDGTAYLLNSPANACRLREAMAELAAGEVTPAAEAQRLRANLPCR